MKIVSRDLITREEKPYDSVLIGVSNGKKIYIENGNYKNIPYPPAR